MSIRNTVYLLLLISFLLIPYPSLAQKNIQNIDKNASLFRAKIPSLRLYDSAFLERAVGYLENQGLLAICEKSTYWSRVCGLEKDLFVKSDQIEEVREYNLPHAFLRNIEWSGEKLTARIVSRDGVSLDTRANPSIWLSSAPGSSEIEINITPVIEESVFVRMDPRSKNQPIRVEKYGEYGVKIVMPNHNGCGFRVDWPFPSFATLEIRKCKKNGLVVIDPGHGGEDKGACVDGICECERAFEAAMLLKSMLSRHGIKSVLTREKDEVKTLQERALMGFNENPMLFVSLHFDNWVSENKYSEAPDGLSCYFESEISRDAAFSICDVLPLKDYSNGSIFKRSLFVIQPYWYRGVLIELGNLSVKSNYDYLKNDNKLRNLMSIIASRIKSIVGRHSS